MDSDQVRHAVCQVLEQIQRSQNLDCPPLDSDVRPIRDLKKFDSPMSLAATGMVGRKLGLKINPKVNIFGDKSGLYTLARTIALVCKIAAEQPNKEPAKA